MNEVGRHGIFLFGGQSKRLSNAVHRCDPSTLAWSVMDTVGVRIFLALQPAYMYLAVLFRWHGVYENGASVSDIIAVLMPAAG